MRTRERRRLPFPPLTRGDVRRELSFAAGVAVSEHRDPVAQLSESFRTVFERRGLLRTAGVERQLRTGSGFLGREGETKASPAAALHRFSQIAFQHGALSAAILEGSGKMMLVSCLKGALVWSTSEPDEPRTLFDVGGQRRNVPGRDPDQMLFNRGVAGSAVGIVVDALRDASRVVQSMREMAEGTGELKASEGGVTLRTLYPFLEDTRERELLERYAARLRDCTDVQERPVLQNALVHTRAALDKKAQMREEFTSRLRVLSSRAEEALTEFEAPQFAGQIIAALLPGALSEPPDEPPDGPGGGKRHGAGSEDHAAGDGQTAGAGEKPAEGSPGRESGPPDPASGRGRGADSRGGGA